MWKRRKKERGRVRYKIYRASAQHEARGWLGIVDEETLSAFSCPEEYLSLNFGGGEYFLHEMVDGELTGRVYRYKIAGFPIVKGYWSSCFPIGRPAVPSPEEVRLAEEVKRLRKEKEELQRRLREMEREQQRREMFEELNRQLEMLRRDMELKRLKEKPERGEERKKEEEEKKEVQLSELFTLYRRMVENTSEMHRQMIDQSFRMLEMMLNLHKRRREEMFVNTLLSGIAEIIADRDKPGKPGGLKR